MYFSFLLSHFRPRFIFYLPKTSKPLVFSCYLGLYPGNIGLYVNFKSAAKWIFTVKNKYFHHNLKLRTMFFVILSQNYSLLPWHKWWYALQQWLTTFSYCCKILHRRYLEQWPSDKGTGFPIQGSWIQDHWVLNSRPLLSCLGRSNEY